MAENVVEEEKQSEVGGPNDYKKTYSSISTILGKLETDKKPWEDEYPVCRTSGEGGPSSQDPPLSLPDSGWKQEEDLLQGNHHYGYAGG